MIEKKAATEFEIHHLLEERWSGRAYDAEREVATSTIGQLIEASRWAPSCYGDQPWRFVICNKFVDENAWEKAFSCLAEGNQSWAIDAPVLMLVCSDTLLSANGKPNRWGQYDAGAAMMSFSIQATALGLMVHQMGGYNPELARTTFAVPEQYDTIAMVTVGYQLSEDELSDEQKERELAARSRANFSSHFFSGSWGNPIDLS